jgi:hypothetical protein
MIMPGGGNFAEALEFLTPFFANMPVPVGTGAIVQERSQDEIRKNNIRKIAFEALALSLPAGSIERVGLELFKDMLSTEEDSPWRRYKE